MSEETGPHLRELFCLFRPLEALPPHEVISPDEVPPPYHDLLVHEHHMTVTVEAHHGDLVDVRILERVHEGDVYARKILLTLQKTGKVVQFGVVRVDLSFIPPAARAEIVAGQKPFGRILIEHDVHRRVEPTTYLRIWPGPGMMAWFALDEPKPLYGRLAYIHCDGRRAVELLEVVAPE
jgi:hypothetical protein